MQKEKGSQQLTMVLLLVDEREWSRRLIGEKGDDGDDRAARCWYCKAAMLWWCRLWWLVVLLLELARLDEEDG